MLAFSFTASNANATNFILYTVAFFSKHRNYQPRTLAELPPRSRPSSPSGPPLLPPPPSPPRLETVCYESFRFFVAESCFSRSRSAAKRAVPSPSGFVPNGTGVRKCLLPLDTLSKRKYSRMLHRRLVPSEVGTTELAPNA